MKILRKAESPRYQRKEGITSYLLASRRTAGSKHLTTTLVEIEPGGKQRVHRHEPEQIYFIIEGAGLMAVDDDQEEVGPGDCVFIPSGASHGLENHTDSLLRYFSAAAPSFNAADLDTLWPLASERNGGG